MAGNNTKADARRGDPRGRGRPPVLSRDKILAVARDLPPDRLTMQAVADALGVDRTALRYHVSDREALVEMVAAETFESEMARIALPLDGDWRDLLRTTGYALRATLVRAGKPLNYADIGGLGSQAAFGVINDILKSLMSSGFELEDAGCAIAMVFDLAYVGAREMMLEQSLKEKQGRPDPVTDIDVVIQSGAAGDFAELRGLIEKRIAPGYREKQFQFELATMIAGMEILLEG